MEYQQKQKAAEKQQQQQQQQQQFNIQSIAAVVKTLHDNQSPYVQHPQYPHPAEQNHNNNNGNYIYNGLLIAASHDAKNDDDNDDDDAADDYSRHSFYDYYNASQDEEEEKAVSSNKLLVTFDYGFSDSIEQQQQLSDKLKPDVDEYDYHNNNSEIGLNFDEDDDSPVWTICNSHHIKADAAQFPVHRMRHNIKDNEMSILSTLIEYDVDEESEEMLQYTPRAGSKIKLFAHNYEQRYFNDYDKRGVRIEAVDIDADDDDVDDDDDEEEFYDSLESATFSRFARA